MRHASSADMPICHAGMWKSGESTATHSATLSMSPPSHHELGTSSDGEATSYRSARRARGAPSRGGARSRVGSSLCEEEASLREGRTSSTSPGISAGATSACLAAAVRGAVCAGFSCSARMIPKEVTASPSIRPIATHSVHPCAPGWPKADQPSDVAPRRCCGGQEAQTLRRSPERPEPGEPPWRNRQGDLRRRRPARPLCQDGAASLAMSARRPPTSRWSPPRRAASRTTRAQSHCRARSPPNRARRQRDRGAPTRRGRRPASRRRRAAP